MSPRIMSSELSSYAGELVTVAGWLLNRRAMGGVTFLVLRDRAGTLQVVVDPEVGAALDGLQLESVLQITGTVVEDARARGGAELHAQSIEVLSPVTDVLPFEINKPQLKPSLDILLDHAALSLRHAHRRAAFEVMAVIVAVFTFELVERDFTEIFTSKLVGTATEGGANVFTVDYFEQQAYLAQSPQFYKQIMVGVLERVFEIGPVFRAEPHATTRHLNEYVSLDLEFGFIRDHRDVMALVEELLRAIMARVAEACGPQLELFGATVPDVVPIPIVDFREAQEIILAEFGEDCRHEPDLSPQHERWLGQWALREHGSDFLFVEGFPLAKRPFYTMPNPERPEVSNSFDVLFRGLELVTGGQREHRYEKLLEELARREMSPEPFSGYLNAFRFGMPPEGGCAFGLERFVSQLLGVANVREVRAFPRDIQRLRP